MLEKQQEIDKELKNLILEGTCPHCNSVRIKYHEYIRNRTFGFQCLCCGWESKYNLTELNQASVNWFSRQK